MALVSVEAGAVGNRTYGMGGDRDFLSAQWELSRSVGFHAILARLTRPTTPPTNQSA